MPLFAVTVFAGCEQNSSGDGGPGPASLTITDITTNVGFGSAAITSVLLGVFPKDYPAGTAGSLSTANPDLLAGAVYSNTGYTAATGSNSIILGAGSYSITAELYARDTNGGFSSRWKGDEDYSVYLFVTTTGTQYKYFKSSAAIHIKEAVSVSIGSLSAVTF